MKILNRTISLKLTEGHEAFRHTLSRFCEALNFVSQYAHDNRVFSYLKLQKNLYHTVRGHFGLKAQMTCSVFRQVAASYKHDDPKKQTKKRSKVVKFKPSAMILQGGDRDWKFNKDGTLGVTLIPGRMSFPYDLGDFQRDYLDGSWEFGAATLIERNGQFYLNISLTKEVEITTNPTNIVGVDLGQNYLAVASNVDDEAMFFKGGKVKNKHRHYRRLRKALQTKGTRGAKKVLKKISGKQRRFHADVNHCISKKVVAFAAESGNALIALEDLTGIRDRAKHRKKQRSMFHGWSFFQLKSFISYKAEAKGMDVVLVDPRNTSKACSRCGNVADGQRKRHDFFCKACGFSLHSDLNASRNIAQRARLLRQGLSNPGCSQSPHEVSSVDPETRTCSGTEGEDRCKLTPVKAE